MTTNTVRAASVVALPLLLAGSLHAQGVQQADLSAGLEDASHWLTYSGDYSGQRHSPADQITTENADKLQTQWVFQTGLAGHKFEATPLAVDGTLYVSGPMNYAWAIDGTTGEQLWQYRRNLPPMSDLRVCCGMVNRGFAILGDRLFMTTLDAHLVALDRHTGEVLWDVEMGENTQGYAATVAPLVVDGKVIAGVAGGEFAIRGFLDAYDPETGERIWRFWTIPAPGEPGSETWPPEIWERGGAPTWLTGTYDPDLGLLYWGTGNPNPDFYGANREGDNLFSNALLALDVETGQLEWYFQFTPHDEHDWDANQIPVLADIEFEGEERSVVMVANRNGFFFVLDRATGEFLRATPFIRQTWADGFTADGRPIEIPGQRPTPQGTLTCPDLFGGTNFMSPSYVPDENVFVVTVRETCQIFISREPPADYQAGDRVMGGTIRPSDEPSWGALRAIDVATGQTRWEVRHETPGWGGVLSTAGGVVFSGNAEGEFLAVDAESGEVLLRRQLGAPIYAAPMTYMADGRQHVALASGSILATFALPE